MQKKLLIFLTVLVVGLLIANVVVLILGFKKLTDKHSSPKLSRETSQPVGASAGSSVQIKHSALNHSFVALPSGIPHLVSSDQESIGTQAGKTVGELQEKTQQSYEVLNQQAQQTAAELQKTSEQAMVVLNQQTAKTAQELQIALAGILQNFNVELEKFNQELKKKQTT